VASTTPPTSAVICRSRLTSADLAAAEVTQIGTAGLARCRSDSCRPCADRRRGGQPREAAVPDLPGDARSARLSSPRLAPP
jgi:hypothetical protein